LGNDGGRRSTTTEEVSMNKSPGHQKWPEHKVQESPMDRTVTVEVDGQVVAESRNVIRVDEDHHPARYYFPRADVKMQQLERSESTSQCPFKGTANYFHLKLGNKKFENAVWTYEAPYDEHLDLSGRLAFYDDKVPEIKIKAAA
jgi:uncharacterized protein (DUF427 family)